MINASFQHAFFHPHPLEHNARSTANIIRTEHVDDLLDIWSIIKHPRSLTRPESHWRPPTKRLPTITQIPATNTDQFSAVISRHRVGPKIQHQLHVFNEATERQAAYVITFRITHTDGIGQIPHYLAEGWVRALVGEKSIDCVHEIRYPSTSAYIWVVDGSFRPIHSPASLFKAKPQSA